MPQRFKKRLAFLEEEGRENGKENSLGAKRYDDDGADQRADFTQSGVGFGRCKKLAGQANVTLDRHAEDRGESHHA